jgi:hypothetical protein
MRLDELEARIAAVREYHEGRFAEALRSGVISAGI